MESAQALTPQEVLKRQRAEFDWLWDYYGRERGEQFNMTAYCAALENMVLNRFAEAGLVRYQFGKGGIAGLATFSDSPAR